MCLMNNDPIIIVIVLVAPLSIVEIFIIIIITTAIITANSSYDRSVREEEGVRAKIFWPGARIASGS